ncbi:flavin monoamine oxidase family protein [Roseovarius pelagicus]|uniref:Tryptophan 2-monooxygenase n=1 Tax=Roseovarius pelagicus TaxID=2980108 RepID=A0ABY6D8G0_9RHOB|nr:NAD(P)/FAD-dependent oxidoreductase [Roseovarius pelagicus]UXX82426.1 FAD-dependent oxidoreductase [Roseovarius pelagicus]
MSAPDVVIIGAGAAGVGAGMALKKSGVSFVIVEGADRVGGRAFTDTTSLGVAWDHGCHWMHCADENPLVAMADRFGARYDKRNRDDQFAVWQGGAFATSDALSAADAAVTRAFEAIEAAGRKALDVPIPDVLPDAGQWTGGVDCILALMSGDVPRDVSAAAYADYVDTDVNWPVLSGYGDLITRMAAGLPVRTGVRVSRIDQQANGVRVETDGGPIEARAAIVTASTNVLTSGNIGFGAGPACDLVQQLEHVPCGAYEKVAFALDTVPEMARDKVFINVDPGNGIPAISFQVMDHDQPLLIAHFAGDIARELSTAGAAAMTDFATGHMTTAFGSDVARTIRASAVTNWTQNPMVQGSYSHARPGYAQLRRDLIAADTGNVAFAGEAFSTRWQATAHGAWLSGQDVAARIAAQLG